MGSRAPADQQGRQTNHHHRYLSKKMLHLVPLLALASDSPATSPASSLLACKACSPPAFPPTPQGRPLWLPHCVNGKSLNFCDAVCSGEQLSSENQGSCEGCEAKCGMVFTPVCSLDQRLIFPNQCQAHCAGVETVDCKGLNTVIPGKTKLPLSHQLPAHLQDFGSIEGKSDEDA